MKEIKNEYDYRERVKSLALDLVEYTLDNYNSEMLAMDEDMTLEELELQATDGLHEWIDSTELLVYYWGQNLICQYSKKVDAYDEEIGGDFSGCSSFQDVKGVVAYFALYADVSEHISGCCADVLAKMGAE
jgi:hypothetical protein